MSDSLNIFSIIFWTILILSWLIHWWLPIALILLFFGSIFLLVVLMLFNLDLNYVGFTLLIIYLGAILILFLFVAMLIPGWFPWRTLLGECQILTLFYTFNFFVIYSVVYLFIFTIDLTDSYDILDSELLLGSSFYSNPEGFSWVRTCQDLFAFSEIIYTYYWYIVIFSAFALLVGLVGCVCMLVMPVLALLKNNGKIFVILKN